MRRRKLSVNLKRATHKQTQRKLSVVMQITVQSNQTLDRVTFGPTKIQIVPPDIAEQYLWERFHNCNPCNLHGLYENAPKLHVKQCLANYTTTTTT